MDAASPLFSIIVTTYYSEETVCRCLDSILEQTERSYEIIIVDDASQDSTVSVLQQYAAKHDNIKLILHTQNCGQAIGLNEGIRAARGEYISIVDSDDWLSADCYEKRKASLCTAKNADVLIFGYTLASEKNGSETYTPMTLPFPVNQPLCLADIVKSATCIHTKNLFTFSWRMLFRREFLIEQSIFNNEEMVVGVDTDFNMRALQKAKVIVAGDEVGYFYNIRNQNSIMHRPYKKTFEQDMDTSYRTRTAMCMDIEAYRRDLVEYYVKLLTFLMIHNQIKSPEGLTPASLRHILQRRCIRETWKATGWKLYHKGFRDLILRVLIKLRMVHLYCFVVNRSQSK